MEVRLVHKKTIPDYKDGAIRFGVQMKFQVMIQYIDQGQLFPLDKQALDEIGQSLKQVLQGDIQSTISQSQTQYQSDYLQFYYAFRMAYTDVYDMINWPEEYPKAQIGVHIQIDISVRQKMDFGQDKKQDIKKAAGRFSLPLALLFGYSALKA